MKLGSNRAGRGGAGARATLVPRSRPSCGPPVHFGHDLVAALAMGIALLLLCLVACWAGRG